MNDMYSQNIIEHYNAPRNFGRLKNHTHFAREINSLCGDEIEMFLNVKDNVVKDIGFIGNGCAISQASCSMLTENIKGKSLDETRKLTKDDIIKMLGISISPVRLKCALMSLSALFSAIN